LAAVVAAGWADRPRLVIDPAAVASHCSSVYDFYKPNPAVETPLVAGHFSIDCYLASLARTWAIYRTRVPGARLRDYARVCFHTPFAKMTQKAFSALYALDAAAAGDADALTADEIATPSGDGAGLFCFDPVLLRKLSADSAVRAAYARQTEPTLILARRTGNTYAASLWLALASALASDGAGDAQEALSPGDRILLFSYGSGMMATIFSLRLVGNRPPLGIEPEPLLAARTQITVADQDEYRARRSQLMARLCAITTASKTDDEPVLPADELAVAEMVLQGLLWPGQMLLASVSAVGVRKYVRAPV
jgi:hydroxymethylglutaryl-CoA synthase